MNTFELQKLRDLPIEGVAERLGLRVCRHKCLCPFHDDHHASLSFSVSRNTFRCFACGAHGGTIDLVMKHENKDFLEACRWLADGSLTPKQVPPRGDLEGAAPTGRLGTLEKPLNVASAPQRGASSHLRRRQGWEGARYARFFEHPFLNEAARHFLFEERKLDERVVRWCRLTSWRDRQGINWLQIPYFDREGKLIGLQNRNLSLTPKQVPPRGDLEGAAPRGGLEGAAPRGGLEGAPRFRFPQGSECSIYNLPILNQLSPGEDLYITEGCSDCWAMLSAGHKAIAIPSATLLKPKDVTLLKSLYSPPLGEDGRGPRFHMYPDRDEPGERLFLQLKEKLPNLEHHQLPPDCKDFSEYYLQKHLHPPP